MKLLLNQGLPRSTVRILEEIGIEAEHVGDLGLATAADASILEIAIEHNSVVVTLDADFHSILALAAAARPSVVQIRIEGLKGEQLAMILSQVVETASDQLEKGAVASVTPGRIRIHSLPIS